MTPDEHAEMRASLESAMGKAPNDANVASMLAIIYLDEYWVGFNPRHNPVERALQCAQRATIAAPSNSPTMPWPMPDCFVKKSRPFELLRSVALS